MDILAPDKDFLDIILLIIQILTLIALIFYVKKTWDMAVSTESYAQISGKTLEEMKQTRDQEISPYVVCYFDFEGHDIYLVVENVGKGLAKDVKLEFNPEIKCDGYAIENTPLILNGIQSLPPTFKIRTYFDDSPTYLNSGLPLSYHVKVRYFGGINHEERVLEYDLDLNFYHGIHFLGKRDINDLVKEIEQIKDIQEKILRKL